MLDDRYSSVGGVLELADQLPTSVEVDDVVIAKFFALELFTGGDAFAGAVSVEGGLLVGVFAVAKGVGEGLDDTNCGRQGLGIELRGLAFSPGLDDGLEGGGDAGIVGGGGGEGLLGEPPAGGTGEAAVVLDELGGESCVVRYGGHDGYVFEVLGGGANHGRAADVDVLDDVGEGYVRLLRSLFKGVEVDDHHVDGLDGVLGDGG